MKRKLLVILWLTRRDEGSASKYLRNVFPGLDVTFYQISRFPGIYKQFIWCKHRQCLFGENNAAEIMEMKIKWDGKYVLNIYTADDEDEYRKGKDAKRNCCIDKQTKFFEEWFLLISNWNEIGDEKKKKKGHVKRAFRWPSGWGHQLNRSKIYSCD